MSLLDKASLIVTPNGYKASKLYSVVPSNGSGDMTVTRATTATRVNASGLIESVANNVPRLDYLNSACPTLLLEPQRTNLQTYSEDFSNAVYIKVGATVSTNTDASPDGTTTADRLSEDSSTGIHTAAISAGQATGGDYTFSVFVKANGRTKFQLAESFSIGGAVNFDLTAVTATTTAPAKNGKIENYGNGWFRCSATWTFTSGATTILYMNLLNGSGSASYAGNGASGVILWGAQLEFAGYGTSYIKTTTASVTRNSDVINKTAITSLIGQTEGTIFIDTNINNQANQINEPVLLYVKGTSYAFIEITPTGLIGAYNNGSTFTGLIVWATSLQNGRHKFAFSYKNNDFILYSDGVQVGTDTSGLISGTLTSFGLQYDVAQYEGRQNINSAQLYKTRLSNTELAQLTTI